MKLILNWFIVFLFFDSSTVYSVASGIESFAMPSLAYSIFLKFRISSKFLMALFLSHDRIGSYTFILVLWIIYIYPILCFLVISSIIRCRLISELSSAIVLRFIIVLSQPVLWYFYLGIVIPNYASISLYLREFISNFNFYFGSYWSLLGCYFLFLVLMYCEDAIFLRGEVCNNPHLYDTIFKPAM